MRRSISFIIIISVLHCFGFTASARVVRDGLHGVEVDLPPGYFLRVPSGLGRILVVSEDGLGGLSVFVLKNPRARDPLYFVKVFSVASRESRVFYRKLSKDSVVVVWEAPYSAFAPYFDLEYSYAAFYTGNWARPVKAAVLVRRGHRYTLVMVAVPPPGCSLKDLFSIASSLRINKPFRPYHRRSVRSVLFGIPAYYVDVPEGWSLENRNTIGRYGEVPSFCVRGKDGGACYFQVWTQSYQNLILQTPMGMATVYVPGQGERQWSSYILSPESAVSLYLGFFGFGGPVRIRTGKEVMWVEKMFAQSSQVVPVGMWMRRVYIYGSGVYGEGILGEVKVRIASPYMAALSVGYMGFIGVWWGDSDRARSVAEGVVRSVDVNPEWDMRQTKVMNREMRKELAHRMWIWREFRKTQDYINRLHRGTIRDEEIFQEEMARAYTNILSDYTYARDPETGEVFHLEDDAREYWRNVEGDIVKFENEVLDPRALEAEGWRRLEVRPEGFGKW